MSPDRAIFFDIDDTLIATKSMFDFQRFYFEHAPEYRDKDPDRLMDGFRDALMRAVPDGRRDELNRIFYESFAGRDATMLSEIAEDWFSKLCARRGDALWVESALRLLEEHRAKGFLIVGVSGSCYEILRGIARHLGLDHLLAAKLEQREGHFTGRLIPPQTIGPGKRIAILEFAERVGLDLARSAACGDHRSDLAMLEAVGTAYVVAGDPLLEAAAHAHNWTILPHAKSENQRLMKGEHLHV